MFRNVENTLRVHLIKIIILLNGFYWIKKCSYFFIFWIKSRVKTPTAGPAHAINMKNHSTSPTRVFAAPKMFESCSFNKKVFLLLEDITHLQQHKSGNVLTVECAAGGSVEFQWDPSDLQPQQLRSSLSQNGQVTLLEKSTACTFKRVKHSVLNRRICEKYKNRSAH